MKQNDDVFLLGRVSKVTLESLLRQRLLREAKRFAVAQ